MAIGKLWKFFGNRTRHGDSYCPARSLFCSLSIFYSGYQSSDRCVECHADTAKMTSLGYPQFVMTREQVQKEVAPSEHGMP